MFERETVDFVLLLPKQACQLFRLHAKELPSADRVRGSGVNGKHYMEKTMKFFKSFVTKLDQRITILSPPILS